MTYHYHSCTRRTANFTCGLEDLIKYSQNLSKGESTMKNTNKKPTPSSPIEKVSFNGPATIVYWKDGLARPS